MFCKISLFKVSALLFLCYCTIITHNCWSNYHCFVCFLLDTINWLIWNICSIFRKLFANATRIKRVNNKHGAVCWKILSPIYVGFEYTYCGDVLGMTLCPVAEYRLGAFQLGFKCSICSSIFGCTWNFD